MQDKAFVSTSGSEAFHDEVMFTIEGVSGRDVSLLSDYPDEKEILFQPDTRFEVVEREERDGVTHIRLREVAGG